MLCAGASEGVLIEEFEVLDEIGLEYLVGQRIVKHLVDITRIDGAQPILCRRRVEIIRSSAGLGPEPSPIA